MIPFNTQTLILRRLADLMRWIKGLDQEAIDIVIDPAVADHEATVECIGTIRNISQKTRVLLYDTMDALGLQSNSIVVAIGGGLTLDAVKVRAYADALNENARYYLGRSGQVMLPEISQLPHPVIAIPTTLGTGSEASQVAVLIIGSRRYLLLGDGLAPRLALHFVSFLDCLPSTLLSEGVLEIFARLIGLSIGNHLTSNIEDAVVHAYVRYITPPLTNPDLLSQTEWKDDLLKVGARSHQLGVTEGRSYYGVKWWPIVNEICALNGSRKVPVLTTILPLVTPKILSGDERWGCESQLRAIWNVVLSKTEVILPDDPVHGIKALFSMHVDPVSLSVTEKEQAAINIMHAWGHGLPMFKGFDETDIAEFLQEAVVNSRHDGTA